MGNPVALVLIAVGLGVAGQMAMKSGMTQVGQITSVSLPMLGRMFTNLYVLLGIAFYGLSSVVYLMGLSRLPLSAAYPMVGLGYVVVVILSWLFLKENVSWMRWLGVVLICGGAFLIGR
jgi:multidrug transporter EmrE-like cation transporter